MRVRALALKIALLMEEYSREEIAEAVRLLRDREEVSPLVAFFGGGEGIGSGKSLSAKNVKAKAGGHSSPGRLQNLKASDPTKYKLLKEFEGMLRDGVALPTLEDVRRFGERVSKDFVSRKSRSDSIAPLLWILAERSTDELEVLIKLAKSSDSNVNEDQYLKLARYLIRGHSD